MIIIGTIRRELHSNDSINKFNEILNLTNLWSYFDFTRKNICEIGCMDDYFLYALNINIFMPNPSTNNTLHQNTISNYSCPLGIH